MLKFKYFIGLTFLFFLSSEFLLAQVSVKSDDHSKQVTYLLPGGKVFQIAKWDSLEQAWGKGRIIFNHNEEDDKKGIVHLVHLTEEERKELDNRYLAVEKSFAAMLNKPAPEFELTDLQGKRWSLKALRGKVVVLNFWFTSCAPCIQEMPELNTLVYMYGHGTAVFLALTFNDADKVKSFLEKRKFDYVLLPNSEQVDKQYHISTWPTSMVIDKEGKIRKIIQSNPKIREELASAIEAADQIK